MEKQHLRYHRSKNKPASTGSVLSIADLQEARPCWTLWRTHLSVNVMWSTCRNACREEGSLSAGPGRVGNSFSLSVIRELGRQTASAPMISKRESICTAEQTRSMDSSLPLAVILVLDVFTGFGTAVPHAVAAISSCCLHSGTSVFLIAACESSTCFYY